MPFLLAPARRHRWHPPARHSLLIDSTTNAAETRSVTTTTTQKGDEQGRKTGQKESLRMVTTKNGLRTKVSAHGTSKVQVLALARLRRPYPITPPGRPPEWTGKRK